MGLDIPPSYRPLGVAALADYLAEVTPLRDRLGGSVDDWVFGEVSDGYLNLVHLVDGPDGALCVKQALPHVRQDKNWPLPLDRSSAEALYWRTLAPFTPGFVPKIFHYDRDLALIVMEKLAPHRVLRGCVVADEISETLGAKVGEFVARATFFTSDHYQKLEFKHRGIAGFNDNDALHRIMLELVYQDPFIASPRNHWTSPHLDDLAESFRTDPRIRIAAGRLAHKYLANAQALIHNDLRAGAIMLHGGDVRVIDPEFATFGPIGVDLGIFIGHLLIGYYAQDGYGAAPGARAAQQQSLLAQIAVFVATFRRRFLELWRVQGAGDAYLPVSFSDAAGQKALEREREIFVDAVLDDAIRFAAPAIVRAIVGYSHFAEMESIADKDRKAAAEVGALSLARDILISPERYPNIPDVINAAPGFRRPPGRSIS